MKKASKHIYVIAAAAFVLVIAAVLAVMYFQGLFYARKDVQAKKVAASDDIFALASASKADAENMLSRTALLLKTGTKTSPFVCAWYTLPGTTSSMPAQQSEYLLATDQVLLLRCYVEAGDQDKAETLSGAIEKYFMSGNGLLVPFVKAADLPFLSGSQPVYQTNPGYEQMPDEKAFSMEATVGYLRALLDYYSKWGRESDWNRIEDLASAIYSEGAFTEDMTIEIATPTPLPVGEGQDIVSTVDGETPKGGTVTMIKISSLDTEAFRMLSAADAAYSGMLDSASSINAGALISENVPLYAVGYEQSAGGYVYVLNGATSVDLVSSLKVILHLAEQGAAPSGGLRWLKEKLYNQGVLCRSYDVLSGLPTSEEVPVEAYGLVMQIAAAADDVNLYSAALGGIEYNLATNTKSSARDAVFRQMDSARVAVYAKDNLETVLGLYAGK